MIPITKFKRRRRTERKQNTNNKFTILNCKFVYQHNVLHFIPCYEENYNSMLFFPTLFPPTTNVLIDLSLLFLTETEVWVHKQTDRHN